MARYGFYTGQLAIEPYLSRQQIMADCEEGKIPDVYRRGEKGYYIIPSAQVEPYYQSKKLPEFIITQKLQQLKLLSSKQKNDLLTQILQNDAPEQLSLLQNLALS
jgi:hypothetical protein